MIDKDLEKLEEKIAEYFPGQTLSDLFRRIKSLFPFLENIDPKLLDPKLFNNHNTPIPKLASLTQSRSGTHLPLFQYFINNQLSPKTSPTPEDAVRALLRKQTMAIQKIVSENKDLQDNNNKNSLFSKKFK